MREIATWGYQDSRYRLLSDGHGRDHVYVLERREGLMTDGPWTEICSVREGNVEPIAIVVAALCAGIDIHATTFGQHHEQQA